MKITFLLVWAFLLPAFALDSTSQETHLFNRFDGYYSLERASGTRTYYRPVRCTDPVAIDRNTLDARNTKCDFEAIPQTIQNVCPQNLIIRGELEQGIQRIKYVKEFNLNSSLSYSIDDINKSTSTCDQLNFAVCLFIRNTDFYDRDKTTSRKHSISQESIKRGFDRTFTSFTQDQTSSNLIAHFSELRHWAGPEKIPNKNTEYDVTCVYNKMR